MLTSGAYRSAHSLMGACEHDGVTERDATDGPLLRVVRGEPTPEELAALLAVLASRTAGTPDVPHSRSAWNDPARRVRRPVVHGPGGWRSSAYPG